MREGDLVKWIGFPGADKKGIRATGPNCLGLIIKRVVIDGYRRYNVAWSDGSIGSLLYEQTLEVVNAIN